VNNPDPVLRPATAADLHAVTRISRDAYQIYLDRLGREPKPMVQDYAPVIARGEVTILETGGEPAGVLVLEDAEDHLLIYSIALDPAVQGKGFGKVLMAEAERAARSRGHAEIRLYTNEKMDRNIAFYTALGYTETERRSHARYPGTIIVFMSKRF